MLAVVIIPAVGFSAFVAFRYAQAERHAIEERRAGSVNVLSALVDGEVLAVIATLTLLAKAPVLMAGDLLAFRKFAESAIGEHVAVLALLDATGQQLVSTFVPPGEPLPKRPDTLFAPVFQGHILISDIVIGTAVRRPIVSIAVPVLRNGVVAFALSAVVYPERFLGLFKEAGVNPEWAAAVVDRQGRFVSRNLSPEQYVGSPARPMLVSTAEGVADSGRFENTTSEGVLTGNSFRRSKLTGWTSFVSVPVAVLSAPLRSARNWVAIAALVISSISLLLATVLATRITQSIRSFSDAALALISGKPLPETIGHVSELTEVRSAFELAEQAVADKKRADEHVRFLVEELAHRSKNLLTVVQAVSNRTARSAKTLGEFQKAFNSRLRGLAVSQDLLLKQNWQGAAIFNLVHDHLAPFVDIASDRIKISCPNILLTAGAAQAVGLALHELATNANKYGALSGQSGTVTVTCDVVENDPTRPLRMRWTESGGPAVQVPTRKGFGHVVINEMVSTNVGGSAELVYDVDGFKWTLLISRDHYKVASEDGLRSAAVISKTYPTGNQLIGLNPEMT